jgi:hypothetical protein
MLTRTLMFGAALAVIAAPALGADAAAVAFVTAIYNAYKCKRSGPPSLKLRRANYASLQRSLERVKGIEPSS